MAHAFILGGTKGLGLALSHESYARGIYPVVMGSSPLSSVLSNLAPNEDYMCLDLTSASFRNNFLLALKSWLASHPVNKISHFFWVAGILTRKPFKDSSFEEADRMIDVHLRGPIHALQIFHDIQISPYHLVVISSTSSWRIRENESLYCALKAAKSAFARNFAKEISRDLPGSKVTLVQPGGMKTGLFGGTGQDTSKFMDPVEVAKIIWDEVSGQSTEYKEVQIIRNEDGSPKVGYGPKIPETVS